MTSDDRSSGKPKYRITLELVNNAQWSRETTFQRDRPRRPIAPEYIERIKDEVKAAGIPDTNPEFSMERMVVELEAAVEHYLSAKGATQITPKILRGKHAEATNAIENAIAAYADYERLVSRSGRTLDEIQDLYRDSKGLENLRQHLWKDGLALEDLPERMPKTFHEVALASHVFAAFGAVGPEGMCATKGGVYENVLAIVLEFVGARVSDPHRLAIKMMDEHPVQWAGRGKVTKRGKKKRKSAVKNGKSRS